MIIKADEQSIKSAAELIKRGQVIAFPTETVYGLGADAFNVEACKKIFELKGRPNDKPLTFHVANYKMIDDIAIISKTAEKLIKKFFPGPLTLILKGKFLSTVGIRMPDCEIALRLIEFANCPIAAPSANISGQSPPITAQEVYNTFNEKIPLIIDGGKCKFSISSTVLDISTDKFKILRAGAINENEIFRVIKNE